MSGSGEYTTTPNLGLYKPTYNADAENWGFHINSNSDVLDAALAGGGPFLPLETGGTVTGATTFNAGLTSTGLHSPGIHFLGLSGADGPSNNWLYANISASGGFTGGDPAADGASGVNKILVTDGAINLGTALYVQFIENGNTDPANQGERSATQSRMIVHGQVGTSGGLFVAQSSIAYAIGSQGGTGGWTGADSPVSGTYYRGALFGGNDNTWLDTGGSNYFMVVGREIDISIFGSANVYQRIGLLMMTKPSTRQGQGDDAALLFGTEDADTFPHKNAIQFGASTTHHSVTDALIKVVARSYGPATPAAYVTGLDFTAATFSGNALASPGFAVNGAGRVTVAGGADFGVAGASGPTDLSKGIQLYTGVIGFSVTTNRLNYVVPAVNRHVFVVNGADRLSISETGTGFNGTAPIAKPTVTGSKGANAALTSLLTALASYGLVVDSTT